ncbi:aminoglycoside phosphotransferase family protein [Aquisediminimonas profunda]|uniref:aminoglycoside phosphotransferase family protein n=1 Tax=Aquisediminimonas profunda TaxID=1550733 RepID=UPI001FEBC549|nr:phosphotransferase [Aquisediminimonas profunda]
MSVSMIPPAAAPDFLAHNGWAGATILPLAGDASFRRYFRVVLGSAKAVLMDAPPPHEDPRPFIAVAQWLVEQGFSAPHILAADLGTGLVLIEDFGGNRMREAIDANPSLERPLYRAVTDLLVELAAKPAMPIAPYSMAEYQRELGIFIDWYCPAVGLAPNTAAFSDVWAELLEPVLSAQSKPVTVLRDYHAENIMLLEGREGRNHLGLLDFQDALAGHPAYDLVSMLQDARRSVSAEIEAEFLAHYVKCASPSAGFVDAYHVLGVQRNLKILGIFTRLWKRDGKPRYRAFQPRVWAYLERSLAHPALAPAKAWMDANIPTEKRAQAWIEFVE